MKIAFRLQRALALPLVALPAPLCAKTPAPPVEYRVNKGDTLHDLAERYFANPASYLVVQRLNNVINPRRMPVGLVLKIPRSLLRRKPIQATIQNYHGTVLVGTRNAAVGMKVGEGTLIETGRRSFVALRLPDGSTVSLPSGSRIHLERLRLTQLTESVERRFVVQRGQATGTVTPMADPESSFQLGTPRAITSVRGTQFRIGYEPESGNSRVEVVEGKVAYRGGKRAEQLVAAGFGLSDRLQTPVPLLAPPALAEPGKVQDEEDLIFALEPVAGAIRYHLQIARDAGFLDMIDESYSDRPESRFPAVANGTYFVRSMAIDANGLEGQPTTYSFERRLNRLHTSLEQGRVGKYRQFLFRWQTPDQTDAQFRFQLSRNADGSNTVVDQAGLKGSSFIITDLPSGTYYWRVMSMNASGSQVYTKWSQTNELRVEVGR